MYLAHLPHIYTIHSITLFPHNSATGLCKGIIDNHVASLECHKEETPL